MTESKTFVSRHLSDRLDGQQAIRPQENRGGPSRAKEQQFSNLCRIDITCCQESHQLASDWKDDQWQQGRGHVYIRMLFFSVFLSLSSFLSYFFSNSYSFFSVFIRCSFGALFFDSYLKGDANCWSTGRITKTCFNKKGIFSFQRREDGEEKEVNERRQTYGEEYKKRAARWIDSWTRQEKNSNTAPRDVTRGNRLSFSSCPFS